MFRSRSVVEIMVLAFTAVVSVTITGLGGLIIVVEMKNPEADTGLIANTLMSLISGMLGALLGLIAGKSATMNKDIDLHTRPNGRQNDRRAPQGPAE